MPPMSNEETLREYYRALYRAWGAQHWWPGETRFEVIVGAYLTQNTSWTNVERALANLRSAKRLSIEGVRKIEIPKLEQLIRPSGYFRQKARRLKTFVAFLDGAFEGSLDQLFAQPTEKLREQLLALNGVGPETADSILLYAGNRPVFVVDAYTRRILDRHRILSEKPDYEGIRGLFERSLKPISRDELSADSDQPREHEALKTAHPLSPMSRAHRAPLAQVYNEMHGLIVSVGKHHCGKLRPQCDGCPLQPFLPQSK